MPDLPSGTVTFLFTDIEGSTALWERDREAMAAAVERHLALLRTSIETHNGVLFKVVGDAIQAAFPTASEAVTAALDAQQALQREAWSDRMGSLCVRMALHTVAAEPRNGDYLAPGLNRLARVLAAAHGGQVLLSLATQDLARDALPSGADLQDLGEHPLRDLYRPERVFQLRHPDLPADFPPIRTLATRPNNLPLQQTPFVGREEPVGQVVDLLRRDDVRLVTITGPGGVGKTRLALQAAADLLEDFPDGVWLADLSVLDDATLVPSVIANVLGVRDEGSGLTDRLVNVLGEKRLLLVLDNFERVVEAAQAISDVLIRVVGLKILTTSRIPLHAYGEREYPLAPLPLPDLAHLPSIERLSQYEAVRLFIDRAQAVKPDFAVTTANAHAVAEICYRLDGLPLAIELAAAFVKVLPPQALLKRLEKRLPLLTGGSRTLPARQQTMRDAIAWSHDLLTPEEQTLFRRLAVFAGGCTIEAAEAVVNSEGTLDVFGGIASLVNKSLLRQEDGADGEPRFRMLETVREYALEELQASPDEDRMRQAHVAYLLSLAQAGDLADRGRGFESRLARLGAEDVNLRAALEWTLLHDPEQALCLTASLGSYWWLQGRFVDGLELYERVLATGVAPDARERAQVLGHAAWLAINRSDLERANGFADRSLVLAERLGETRLAAYARFCQGSIANARGDGERASVLLNDALTQFEAEGDVWGAVDCLIDLGFAAVNQADPATAAAFFERARDFTIAHQGTVLYRIAALNDMALAYRYLGRRDEAWALSSEALQLAERTDSAYARAASLGMLAVLALDRREISESARLTAQSLALFWEIGEQWNLVTSLEYAAAVMKAADQAEPAARLYGAVAALREALAFPLAGCWRTEYEVHLAEVRSALDEPVFHRAWSAGRTIPLAQVIAEALETMGMIAGS
jgi:predicted ATPase/class 3 adenylate cyclase/tetratricopeptide (TPR) repeat protein